MTVYRRPLAAFFAVNSTVGIIGNAIMVLCFFKNNKFRNPCHILITLLCSSDILNLCGEAIYAVEVFGNMPTRQEICYFMQIIPIIGASAASPLILAIGIDRFVAVHFPTWYCSIVLDKRRYILIMLAFPLIYTIFMLIFGFDNRMQNDPTLFMCSLPMGMSEETFKLFNYASVVIYILVLSVYTAVFVSLKTHSASARFQKVFQSLAVTVLFVLLGWVAATLINMANYLFVTDPDYYEMNIMYSGIPVHFSLSCNIFVFYAINPDYKRAINSLFGVSEKEENQLIKQSSQRVGPSSVV